jgi:hypothetical protein
VAAVMRGGGTFVSIEWEREIEDMWSVIQQLTEALLNCTAVTPEMVPVGWRRRGRRRDHRRWR